MIDLFVKNHCPSCESLKTALTREGLLGKVRLRNIDVDAAALGALRGAGVRSVPAILTGYAPVTNIYEILAIVRQNAGRV